MVSYLLDVVFRLKQYKGKAVKYKGKLYTLCGVRYKTIGTEEMFGKSVPVVEGIAELIVMGTNRILFVPAEDVAPAIDFKWDFKENKWVLVKEQLAIGCRSNAYRQKTI